MKRIVLINGLISGAIVCTVMAIGAAMYQSNPDFKYSQTIGFASMLLAFSLIYFGIRKYRNEVNGGSVTFGRGFLIGLYIALIASSMYVITWAFEYNFLFPDFIEKYAAGVIDQLKAKGASQMKIDAQIKEMDSYRVMYKNPVYFSLLTYMEILPGGIIIALICAMILKKNAPESGKEI